MKRAALLILLTLIITSPLMVGASADEFKVDISIMSTTPEKVYVGDTVSITISVENVSTNEDEKMWEPTLFIDTDFIDPDLRAYITLTEPDGVVLTYTGHDHIGDNIWPGDTTYGVLSFTIAPNAPGGDYRIPIVLVGSRGKCTEGCSPFREDPVYAGISVFHGQPALSVSFDDDSPSASVDETLTTRFTLKNAGTADANSITASLVSPYSNLIGQVNFDSDAVELLPGDTVSGTIAIIGSTLEPGDYTIELRLDYLDGKSKAYNRSKEFSFVITESTHLSFEELGSIAFSDGEDAFAQSNYDDALRYFSQAEGYYELAGMAELASESHNRYVSTLETKISSVMPDPVECNTHTLYLPIGVIAGVLATVVGLVFGVRYKKR